MIPVSCARVRNPETPGQDIAPAKRRRARRTCDGYDKANLTRARETDSVRTVALAIQGRYAHARSDDRVLRILRPLVADINGTQVERLYFHRFRRIAEGGLCNHVTNLTSFWSRLAPQLSHSDEAVKHSIIALGSAYHIYQSDVEERQPSHDLEIFTIQQYSTAMSKLSTYVHVPMENRITVTLLCCVSFVCIESLRKNWRPALTHLSNGLRIIESLPMSMLNKLRDTVSIYGSANNTEEELGMDYILRLFATWEVSCALFAENFKPVISIKLYRGRELDDKPLDEFESITQAHRAIVQYTRDVFALVWLFRDHQGDDQFWSQPIPRRQHEILSHRGDCMGGLFERFMAKPQAPPSGTGEHYSVCLDMLHYSCARLLCENLRRKKSREPSPAETVARYAELVSIADRLHQGFAAKQSETTPFSRSFTLDIGIIPPLYFIIVSCHDPKVQKGAFRILREYPQRENLWDGISVGNLLATAKNMGHGSSHPLKEVATSLAFGTGIPALYERLQQLRIKVEEN
ncbi:C6 zinc finger domain protein [Colletotrichum musicola]|uniref:C6 zinc finger domain protein n=1 Tax=Colletotrichum musicola TaxID=2175873 RepID=A0A8H6KFT5_9PEZI|nr:C6 zinc finger domain protein [Colletotrichum musicola]